MIRNFFRTVMRRSAKAPTGKLRVVPGAQHGLHADAISACALRVTKTLQEAGFRAYIVGGAVRDLLVGNEPKDFDVATNATPDQVRRLIRRSRAIGRRFQIVHVMCHDEVVEVTTFRGPGREDAQQQTDEHGRLTRDNVFGTIEEDAARRDFTVNALYYDPVKNEVLDYFDGVADIHAKRLTMIGDPATRYREDPVRMLRAVRFSAKLGLDLDQATRAPIRDLADLLLNVPESRLFDEILKLLLSGHAHACVARLRTEGLHHDLLPLLDLILDQPQGERFIHQSLENTDTRVRDGKPVSTGFLFASLLWHPVLDEWKRRQAAGEKLMPALFESMSAILETQRKKLAIPRRYDAVMKEIWALQPRFEQRSGQRPFRLLEHPRFRAAYDFMLLRADSGELDEAIADWWTDFQKVGPEEREAMLVPEEKPKRGRGRRRRP
ncbi:MAG: polynucleotide adenylyltransferase PcnB [Betaproteobacteria bacterium]|nr:polynucleotide adenylyltransferase PcnB [Betaproteobacteria bacterium]